eukprot:3696869-Amphidinium_carterae.1
MTDAVVAGFEATPYKSSAIFSLVLFGLNPAEYQEDCKDHLLVTLRGLYTEDEIKNILEDRCAPYREQGFVPLKTLLDVSTAVRLHEPLAGVCLQKKSLSAELLLFELTSACAPLCLTWWLGQVRTFADASTCSPLQ